MCSNSRTHQMETEHGDDRDHGLTGLPDPNSCSLAPPPTDSAADSEKDCSSNRQTGSDQGLIESKTDPLSSNTKRKRSIRRSFVPVCARSEEDTSENDMSDGVSDDEWEPHNDDESPLRHRVCFFKVICQLFTMLFWIIAANGLSGWSELKGACALTSLLAAPLAAFCFFFFLVVFFHFLF